MSQVESPPHPYRSRRAHQHQPAGRRRWRPRWITLIAAVLVWLGLLIFLYPTVAAWFTQYAQSKVVANYQQDVVSANPSRAEQLENADKYNAALISGAVLARNAHVPEGKGQVSEGVLPYDQQLQVGPGGLMARLQIPAIDLDLPVYHGTADSTLLRGLGHLEGTSLPVGGEGTRAVITGHRGLASATMFTNLDRVQLGDSITLEVLGEVLAYRVIDKKVVEPEETEALREEPGQDLLTLVTCTPLGINTHRILVTAARVLPTPPEQVAAMEGDPTVPHFPWWAVILVGSTAVLCTYVWRTGRRD